MFLFYSKVDGFIQGRKWRAPDRGPEREPSRKPEIDEMKAQRSRPRHTTLMSRYVFIKKFADILGVFKQFSDRKRQATSS